MIQSAEPSLQNKTHIHANYQSSYNRNHEQQDRPLQRLRRLGVELDSNSVGPELRQERANEHARRRQNPSIAETPPKADHKLKSSTTVAQQGKSPKQALPTIGKRRLTSAIQPSESRELWAPRRCLQEDHDTVMPPPPDPRILGFHLEEAEKRD
jgi:hypothetical protein